MNKKVEFGLAGVLFGGMVVVIGYLAKERNRLKRLYESEKEYYEYFKEIKDEYYQMYGTIVASIREFKRLVSIGEFKCRRVYDGDLVFSRYHDGDYSGFVFDKHIADRWLGKDYGYEKTES